MQKRLNIKFVKAGELKKKDELDEARGCSKILDEIEDNCSILYQLQQNAEKTDRPVALLKSPAPISDAERAVPNLMKYESVDVRPIAPLLILNQADSIDEFASA